MIKILAESVHDFLRFTEEGDPVKDMGIGVDRIINEWMKEHALIERQGYYITKEKLISTYNTLSLAKLNLGDFPEYINFGYILGGFHVNGNKLTTLRGCPQIVTGSFLCSWNDLKDFIHAPKEVGEDFIASHNELISLDGFPLKTKSLSISNNFLENLKGIPKIINGSFYIHKNPIKTLKYFPDEVLGDLYYTESKILNLSSIKERCKVEGNIINK